MQLARLAFIATLFTPLGAEAAGREEDITQLRRIIIDEGIPQRAADTQDINRKLASMSDHDLRNLAQQHVDMGYSGDPLTVVISSIVLLVLVVLVIVAIVD